MSFCNFEPCPFDPQKKNCCRDCDEYKERTCKETNYCPYIKDDKCEFYEEGEKSENKN